MIILYSFCLLIKAIRLFTIRSTRLMYVEYNATNYAVRQCSYLFVTYTSRVPVEGKSSVCLICMKYKLIILIIIIISLVQILLSYIANTSRMHACTHARTHVRTHEHTCTHTHRRRHGTGYRYSLAPIRDGPLRWQQCRSLAIQINTDSGGPVSLRFWVFLTYKTILGRTETRTRDRMYCQSIRTVRETFPETIEQELRPAVC